MWKGTKNSKSLVFLAKILPGKQKVCCRGLCQGRCLQTAGRPAFLPRSEQGPRLRGFHGLVGLHCVPCRGDPLSSQSPACNRIQRTSNQACAREAAAAYLSQESPGKGDAGLLEVVAEEPAHGRTGAPLAASRGGVVGRRPGLDPGDSRSRRKPLPLAQHSGSARRSDDSTIAVRRRRRFLSGWEGPADGGGIGLARLATSSLALEPCRAVAGFPNDPGPSPCPLEGRHAWDLGSCHLSPATRRRAPAARNRCACCAPPPTVKRRGFPRRPGRIQKPARLFGSAPAQTREAFVGLMGGKEASSPWLGSGTWGPPSVPTAAAKLRKKPSVPVCLC